MEPGPIILRKGLAKALEMSAMGAPIQRPIVTEERGLARPPKRCDGWRLYISTIRLGVLCILATCISFEWPENLSLDRHHERD